MRTASRSIPFHLSATQKKMSSSAGPAASTETYCGLPVYALRDVLSQLSLPPPFNAAHVSSKWRCVLAPAAEASVTVATAEDLLLSEESLMKFLEAGIPVRGHAERAARVHGGCDGDSVCWLTQGTWNKFPKPQIALRRGWGAPGTDMQVSSFHKMIGAFSEVFYHTKEVDVQLTEQELAEAAAAAAAASENDDGERAIQGEVSPDVSKPAQGAWEAEDEVLDLQLFHRDAGCPTMPILGEQLLWPSYIDDGAVCDTATWVSQCGMLRHWHLNDSGEFAMQAALPLNSSSAPSLQKEGSSTFDFKDWLPADLSPVAKNIRRAMCPAVSATCASRSTASGGGGRAAAPSNGSVSSLPPVPAMVAVFAPKGGYDWVLHDDESTMLGRVVALDLFATPDEALPSDPNVLPVFTVAVLESGGTPLLIPPNLAQLSLALRDCVVVEQRRVSNLWLDDVSYFLHRCARWQTNPIIYAYLQQDLQDDAFLAGQVIPFLIRVFAEHNAATAYGEAVRRRAVCSLFALATNEKHYGASESTRHSLLRLLREGNAEMRAVLASAPYRGCGSISDSSASVPATLEAWLSLYWNMSWCWPKPGCVLRTPTVVCPLGTKLNAQQQKASFVPVVYPPTTCSPVYGTEEDQIEGTVQQYFEMKQLESKPKDLIAYLRTRKQPADDLLDELF